jgi:exopolyphosphatase / guanosine-5'-triphosphate,3'-diphosphate pyrophosphatase
LWPGQDGDVPVAVVDVGSNTVRLLVTTNGGRELLSLRETLRLGEAVEQHGLIPRDRLQLVAKCAARYASAARAHGAEAIDVLVTSPGRQATNADELVAALARATRASVRVLSAEEEGRLAFVGALASGEVGGRKRVTVVDVGGGSAQTVVGSRRGGAAWVRSIDLGSMRLTARLLPDDPPGPAAIGRAQAEVARRLVGFTPPPAEVAFAVGGSARALRRLFGARLGAEELADAVALLARTSQADLAAQHGVSAPRTTTLAAGAVILAALQERIELPLRVSRTGLRTGALLELAAGIRAADAA